MSQIDACADANAVAESDCVLHDYVEKAHALPEKFTRLAAAQQSLAETYAHLVASLRALSAPR